MASRPKNTGSSTRKTTARRTRKAPTIDLKATEVSKETEGKQGAETSAANTPKAASSTISAKTEPAGKTEKTPTADGKASDAGKSSGAKPASTPTFGRSGQAASSASTAGSAASEADKTSSNSTAAKSEASTDKKPATATSSTTGSTASKTAEKPSASSNKPAAKASETPKPSTVKSPPPQKSGGGGLVSGLMGAVASVLVLGGIGQMENARDIPFLGVLYGGSQSNENSENSAQIAALREQVENISTAEAPSAAVDLSGITNQISSLETRLEEISASGAAGGETRDAAVDPVALERLAVLETRLNELEGAAQIQNEVSQANTPEEAMALVAALGTRLAKLEASAPSDELASRITSVEEGVKALGQAEAIDLQPLETGLAETKETISGLQETITGNQQAGEALSGTVAELGEQVMAIAGTVTALGESSAALSEQVSSVKASESVAKSVAVAALGTALQNNDSLALPVSSIEALTGATDETERLKTLAKQGVPGVAELVSGLETLMQAVDGSHQTPEGASLTDKLMSNALGLITFRSSGPRDGTDASAVLSRVKAKLEAGDLGAAKAEWETLPDEVKTQGVDWVGALDRRIEAFALYNTLTTKLVSEAG
ncbi:MAG: hypothetical protein AAF217_04405 [Pseudomonadota bacterium]